MDRYLLLNHRTAERIEIKSTEIDILEKHRGFGYCVPVESFSITMRYAGEGTGKNSSRIFFEQSKKPARIK